MKISLGRIRRRELGKVTLDLGKLSFGGTVVTQIFSATAASPVMLLGGLAATSIAVVVGLALTPEE
ncbi:MAG: hypothetical protein AB7P69_15760 [Candidatus Binatia bacterium]